MLDKFYKFAERMKHKNKFFEFLLHNRFFMRGWSVAKFYLTKYSKFKKQKYAFYQQNAARVEKIAK